MMTNSEVALQVVQQAIAALVNWVDPDYHLPSQFQSCEEYPAVTRAKKILGWTKQTNIGTLRLLFDRVKLPDGQGQNKQHYLPLIAIATENDRYPTIPYPLDTEPTLEQQKTFKEKMRKEVLPYLRDNWQNLSLLTLILEKYGSCLSFGNTDNTDVALIDMAKATAAVAAALASEPETTEISLIAGDLSGIQKFIYTISSEGALKSLRARSFYLELVTEEVIQQLLEELALPPINIIYAGGGNFYLLAPATNEIKQKVKHIQQEFNQWLQEKFQNKVFLALEFLAFPVNDVSNPNFSLHWQKIIQPINQQKSQKFRFQINNLLETRFSYGDRCRVCHRDDTTNLKQLNTEEDSVLACPTCREMFQLGSQLFKTKAVLRSSREDISGKSYKLSFRPGCYYYLFETPIQKTQANETLYLINNWNIHDYPSPNSVSLLLGNYGQESYENPGNFIRNHEMASQATGIKKVGYLRMDVDNLGKMFAKGLNNYHTLPRLAGLSRQMSYFFKACLNSLAKYRVDCLSKNAKYLTYDSNGKASARHHLLFIYAGGDDLFVSGSWNELVEFAFDVYQSFRAYTGNHPDITLSGGISINDVKYPLYQAAADSGKAEDDAKANDRDSLGLFGQVFKWDEWLGKTDVSTVDIKVITEAKSYINKDAKIELFGILPFVDRLLNDELNYPQSFIYNILLTAEVQKIAFQELKEKQENEAKYFLHLPKLAYALSRLPHKIREHPQFAPLRRSFMSPYNAPYFRAIATWIDLLTR